MSLAVLAVLCGCVLAAFLYLALAKRLAPYPLVIAATCFAGAIAYKFSGLPSAPPNLVANFAEAALAALAFAGATQFRASRLPRFCPAAFRLSAIASPMFLVAAALSAYVLLPNLGIWSVLLLGAALMVDGAAVDRKALTRAPAPTQIKTAVRMEGAAALVIGVPIAVLLKAAAASTFDADGASLLGNAVFGVLCSFCIGGVAGLFAARIANAMYAPGKARNAAGIWFATGAAVASYILSKSFFGEGLIAAVAAGLLWGEDARIALRPRIRLRHTVEETVTPAAYALFGAVLAPRLLEADLLTLVYAIAVATILRALPRMFALQPTPLTPEAKNFLAWYGGAPGAASALFLITLLNAPGLSDQDALLTYGAAAVAAGVIAARTTSRPLVYAYVRRAAAAKKRRYFEGLPEAG